MREGSPQKLFRTGDCTVYPSENRIERGGRSIHVEPKTMAVLEFLASRPGQVVSAHDILNKVWPGRVVTENTIYRSVSLARKALGDDTETPRYIQTITSKGYRLVMPVTWAPVPRTRITSSRTAMAAALLLTFVLALAGGFLLGRSPVSNTDDIAIAVLPLEDLSPMGDRAYLSEGIAEDALGALSRIPGLRVTSSNSSFMYGPTGLDLDPQVLGPILGVSYLVHGSVSNEGGQLGIQLLMDDVHASRPVLRESLAVDVAEITQVGNRIATTVGERLGLDTSVVRRASVNRHQPKPEAYNRYLKARQLMRSRSPDALHRAKDKLQQATIIDPQFATAYASLAEATLLHETYVRGHASPQLSQAITVAAAAADRALSLDEDLAIAHRAAGLISGWQGADTASEQAYRKALALDPNDAQTLIWLGQLLEKNQGAESGRPYLEKAVQLDPLSLLPRRHLALSIWDESPDEAVQMLQDLLVSYPEDHLTRVILVRILDEMGRLDESLVTLTEATEETSDPATLGFVFERLLINWSIVGDITEARRWWFKAVAAGYDSQFLPTIWAGVLIRDGRLEEAAAVIDEWLARDDTQAWRQAVAYEYEVWAGDTERVRVILDELSQRPLDDYASEEYGNLYFDSLIEFGVVPAIGQAWINTMDGRTDEATRLLSQAESYIVGVIEHWHPRGQNGSRYAMASMLAVKGDKEGAINWLEESVEKGFRDLWRLDHEPFFDDVRDDPRFQKIRADLRADIAAMRSNAQMMTSQRID